MKKIKIFLILITLFASNVSQSMQEKVNNVISKTLNYIKPEIRNLINQLNKLTLGGFRAVNRSTDSKLGYMGIVVSIYLVIHFMKHAIDFYSLSHSNDDSETYRDFHSKVCNLMMGNHECDFNNRCYIDFLSNSFSTIPSFILGIISYKLIRKMEPSQSTTILGIIGSTIGVFLTLHTFRKTKTFFQNYLKTKAAKLFNPLDHYEAFKKHLTYCLSSILMSLNSYRLLKHEFGK